MRTHRNYLLHAFGFTILVVALLLATPLATNAVPSDKDVRVVNTTAEPVPTAAQGTTTITGSVSVSNTPTVTFAPGASVGINPASNTVRINDASQPFQAAASGTQLGNNVSTVNIATVPAGKRLVIEFVSMTGQVPPGQNVEIMEINTSTDPSGGASHQLLIHAQPPAVIGDSLFRAVQEVRLYANAGTQVSALFRRNTGAGLATFVVTISGHLVDM